MKLTLKRTVRTIFTALGGLLVALVLAEIGLRLIGFEFTLYLSRVEFGWPDPITIERRYEADKDLLWVPKEYHARVAAWIGKHPSIVFMGCSCTELGRYDTCLQATITRDYSAARFTFVNLGVAGWSSYQGLQQLKRDVLPMKPGVVTIYYGWNDHWCTFGMTDKDIAKFNRQRPAFLAKLSSKSRIIQLVSKIFFSCRSSRAGPSRRVSLQDFASNLREMVRLCKRNGIVPVLLTAPSAHIVGQEPKYLAERWLKDLSELVPLHEQYVQTVRTVADEENVHLIDLYRLFRNLSEQELTESFGHDGIHLTEVGNERIARYLYTYFMETGLISKLLDPERR